MSLDKMHFIGDQTIQAVIFEILVVIIGRITRIGAADGWFTSCVVDNLLNHGDKLVIIVFVGSDLDRDNNVILVIDRRLKVIARKMLLPDLHYVCILIAEADSFGSRVLKVIIRRNESLDLLHQLSILDSR